MIPVSFTKIERFKQKLVLIVFSDQMDSLQFAYRAKKSIKNANLLLLNSHQATGLNMDFHVFSML